MRIAAPSNALDAGKPPKATPRPPQGHILGIDSGVQRHPKATPRPPQGYPKATPRPPQGHPKATPRLPQGYTTATPRLHHSHLLRLFQRLEGAETACSPRVLAIMRIADDKLTPLDSSSRGPIISTTSWGTDLCSPNNLVSIAARKSSSMLS